MRILAQLIRRNTLLYLRDRASVFFSFLSVIIIIALYILFLGKMQGNDLTEIMGPIPGISWLTSSWIMAGILTVSTLTVPLASLGTLIRDRESGKIADFYTSPVPRRILALSYLVSSWVVSFIMVLLNLVIGQIYVLSSGGELFPILTLIKVIGLFSLSIVSFSSLFFYISLFMKSSNAFSLLSTLVGTFAGFLGGIYIPIGVLGEGVRKVLNLLPTAQSVTLIRKIYMSGAVEKVFSNAPKEAYTQYAEMYGLSINIRGFSITDSMMLIYLLIFAVLFYLLSVLKLLRSKL